MKPNYKKLTQYSLILAAAVLLGACSTAPIQKGDVIEEPYFAPEDVLVPGTTYISDEVPDPWEGFNRTMYRFNYRFDKYFFLPVVNAYKAVVPDIAQEGVHNFFNNIRDITTLINSALQLSADKTFITTGRLMVNTTVGLLGSDRCRLQHRPAAPAGGFRTDPGPLWCRHRTLPGSADLRTQQSA